MVLVDLVSFSCGYFSRFECSLIIRESEVVSQVEEPGKEMELKYLMLGLWLAKYEVLYPSQTLGLIALVEVRVIKFPFRIVI